MSTAPFVQADRTHPFSTTKLFYNNTNNITNINNTHPNNHHSQSSFSMGNDWLGMNLHNGRDHFLTDFTHHDDNFVTAHSDQHYNIIVRNHNPNHIKIIMSVDELNVIDGKPASFAKHDYLINTQNNLKIDDFHTNTHKITTFHFNSVRNSYAARKHGNTHNVGIISITTFNQADNSPRF